jgi:hypothetical protein
MTHSKLCDVAYDEIIHETEKAVLFLIDDKEVWLPRSVIEIDSDIKAITLPERMAIDKGLV